MPWPCSVANHYGVAASTVEMMGSVLYGVCALKFPAMKVCDSLGVNFSLALGVSLFFVGCTIRALPEIVRAGWPWPTDSDSDSAAGTGTGAGGEG